MREHARYVLYTYNTPSFVLKELEHDSLVDAIAMGSSKVVVAFGSSDVSAVGFRSWYHDGLAAPFKHVALQHCDGNEEEYLNNAP